jgi:Trk K+ transport system NAD-binding subunit
VSAQNAKAIIILATSVEADTADANTLRALLSLNTLYNQSLRGFIVAEARDIDNEPLVKLVGNQAVETVVSHDMIGRLMLMSVRQPGLAKVYEALLGYEGDEFYMKNWPELTGVAFGDLQPRFPDAIPIGVFTAGDGTGNGVIQLSPDNSYVLQEGDDVIVIAEDDDTYQPEAPAEVRFSSPPQDIRKEKNVERILICGWRRDIRDILKQLDGFAAQGTEVHMITHCVKIHERTQALLEEGLDVLELKNIKIEHHYGNTSVRRNLDALPIDTYTSCMIFADQMYEDDTMYADSHSLATLLLIRDIQVINRESYERLETLQPRSEMDALEESGSLMASAIERLTAKLKGLRIMDDCPIVCEILDPHTQKTIIGNQHLSILSDFCQTNRLTAQVIAMVAEVREVKTLLDELLGSVGCNIAVVPSSRYVHSDEEINFYEVAQRAGMFGEKVLGYQRRNSVEKTVLNPRDKHLPFAWDAHDFAILQGKMDADERHAFTEIRNAGFSQETHWFLRTVERLQKAATTVSKIIVETEDASKSCEAAFAGMSTTERKKVKESMDLMYAAFRATDSFNSMPSQPRSKHLDFNERPSLHFDSASTVSRSVDPRSVDPVVATEGVQAEGAAALRHTAERDPMARYPQVMPAHAEAVTPASPSAFRNDVQLDSFSSDAHQENPERMTPSIPKTTSASPATAKR